MMMAFCSEKSKLYRRVFLVGVLAHLAYLAVLIKIYPSELWNWTHADSSTYIEPAKSFLEHAQFLSGGVPDYRRTIGSPAFFALALALADLLRADWRLVVYILQAFVFALVYPAIYYLGYSLFGLTNRGSWLVVGVLILSGAFISYTTAVLSDGLFATFLICSVACGVAALETKRTNWWILHFLLLIAAASTRPVLMLFPFAAATYYYYRARIGEGDRYAPVVKKLLIIFSLSLFSIQLPAMRNWINHGIYVSTELSSMALYDYLAKEVLYGKRLGHVYDETAEQINANPGPEQLKERIKARTSAALEVFSDYPVTTAFAMAYNSLLNMVEFHWNNTLFYLFRVNWYKDYADGSVKWSPVSYAAGLIFVMYYGIIYLGAILYLFIERKPLSFLLALGFFLFPLLPAATNYQGARFRLWCEPFVLLAACAAFRYIYECLKKGGENHDRCRE
jgi:4-amino-4-deoxy-L-arabinose transferase-like glycosyltransferase